ncbi:T9SS type A sorting domain-containing protein [Rubrivirga marina]|uniref:T9SS type A sorting domain-containing protein n=1 Tax=Rubrivirga marina TaxID=1196024 RepID=UPI00117A402B|nr:T9SS type A sorting domain-containing protein [Rubrivirga marina]
MTGTGVAYESFAWQEPAVSTPGLPNATLTTTQTFATPSGTSTAYSFGSGDDDVAGFRQLGAALAGIRVDDLASRNLVQGIPGANGYPAQYPDADGTTEGSQGPNLYTAYDGGGYTVAPTTASVLQLGRGLLWYLFDQRIDPDDGLFGGGTSESFPLPQSQTYVGYGLTSGTYVLAFDRVNGQTFYLLANPRASDYDLSGIAMRTAGATISTTFQVYDPGTNGYAALTQGADALAKGQGVWAEVTGVTADAVTFGFDLDATTTGGVFQGRRALGAALDLRLDGVTAGGTTTVDGAARISLLDDATDGWDRHDASKLTPLVAPYALVAPVGTRDGEPRRQAVRSAPVGPVTTDLAFTATEAGTYTLSADVPTGWAADLLDRATGATTDLATASYTFDAGATEWTDRFELAVSPATTAAEQADAPIAEVGRPFPNPAAAGAQLRVRVGTTERVRVVVCDALGREAAVAFDGPLSGGADAVVSLPAGLRPGVYVVRVTGETFAQSRPLVVVR